MPASSQQGGARGAEEGARDAAKRLPVSQEERRGAGIQGHTHALVREIPATAPAPTLTSTDLQNQSGRQRPQRAAAGGAIRSPLSLFHQAFAQLHTHRDNRALS